jgi:BirA family biotin operon repressor/biotin-[acetyl-CoA-carboxylase] ligase
VTHRIDGLDAAALAARLGVPRAALFASVTSTMDEAHRLAAAGAPAGTIVIADEQTAGRGRGGHQWVSRSRQGVWLTLLERPDSDSGLGVLSLRLGLRAAPVLEHCTGRRVTVKWPNDLYVGPRKLAGFLVEARWRDGRPDWVAIGIGVNISAPADVASAIGVPSTTTRGDLLDVLVPALRGAAGERGPLTAAELAYFDARDYARGRACSLPAHGTVLGISSDGALVIESEHGVAQYRTGSLELEGEVTLAP